MRPALLVTTALLAMTALSPAQAQAPAKAPASAAPASAAPAPVAAPAQAPAGDAAALAAPPVMHPSPDQVVAKVNGQEIRMEDLQSAAQTLPPELRGVPMQMLYPMLLNQMVDRVALTMKARKDGVDKDPKVQVAIKRADDEVLQNALLSREVGPSISEDAIRARYDRDYKDKAGEPEVHARHILVKTEDEAKKVIAELKKGANFEDLAKKLSTDPGAQNGGDLGWFKKGEMVPEFADAAFALKPGDITQAPIHTQFGWHVIKVEGTRTAPPQTLEQMHDQIRQALIQEGVRKAVADARKGLAIEEFAPDGSKLPETVPAKSGDATPANATPANAPATATAKTDAKDAGKPDQPGAVAAPPAKH